MSDGSTSTHDVRLVAAAAHDCVYKSKVPTWIEPPCPEEWPGEPWKWCGACFAREIVKEPSDA